MARSSQSIYHRRPGMNRRVVVTGIGAITPLGLTAKTSWEQAVAGQSGVRRITQFDCEQHSCQVAGEIEGFVPESCIPKREARRLHRFTQLAWAAAQMALQDAGYWSTSDQPASGASGQPTGGASSAEASSTEDPALPEDMAQRTGCLIGVGLGGLSQIEQNALVLDKKGPDRVSPLMIPICIANMAAGYVTQRTKVMGPNYSVTSACASSNHAIGEAFRYIQRGYCDWMIAGGCESVITPLGIGGFAAMRALSSRNHDPQGASRPWDEGRDGFVMGEGAAILILESAEQAQRRGAPIYCELSGYGASSDAHHMTAPHPNGRGAISAMRTACEEGEVSFSDVGYINAHGTSTPVGDRIESLAIQKLFGEHASEVSVSSTKSMTGHLLGAAGAVESVFSIFALQDGVVPPTLNLEHPSLDCTLDYTPLVAKEKTLHHVLNNSFGFGGTNACLLFSKSRF